MKLVITTTTELNTREFNDLSDNIIDRLCKEVPEISDLYDIHINFIDEKWHIDFLPTEDYLPVLNVRTHTEFNENGDEILTLAPVNLTDIPEKLKFKGEDDTYDKCSAYLALFEFIQFLSDFKYRLN